MDVGDDSSAGDGGLDEGVQLLVSPDGQLQVAGGDTLHLQVLGGVAGQLQNLENEMEGFETFAPSRDIFNDKTVRQCERYPHLSSQVLEDGGTVDRGGGSDASVRGGAVLQVPVDTAHRELETRARRSRDGLRLGLAGVLACLAAGHRVLRQCW